MTQDTNTASGAAIQRFNNVAGLMNPEPRGLYVRYEDHIAALAAGQATAAPVLWLSPEQFANFVDADEAPFGKYVPARKTSAGKFTMPLFAARAPAPAQPAAEASRFGSPELQAMIIARCVEKDQADSVLELHVGDSAFESWYGTYNPAHKADKQRARDTYEAGWKAGYKHGAWADTPPADSVLEDAARYRWLCCKFGETRFPCALENMLEHGYIADGKPSIDAAIDAARKQGGQHGADN